MGSRSVKRAFDVAVVLLSAPLLLPTGLVIAAMVAYRLGGPVLFKQTRPGLDGRPFTMYKFRSMTNARDALGCLLPDAARLTSFGRWLRSSSLDELPELLNVLRGEMSLVGPRPLLMQYLSRYSPEQAVRNEALPGITGWAQVNGRNAISWDERFKLDTWYVRNQSLQLDLRILMLTIRSVFLRTGISAPGAATMPEFDPKHGASDQNRHDA